MKFMPSCVRAQSTSSVRRVDGVPAARFRFGSREPIARDRSSRGSMLHRPPGSGVLVEPSAGQKLRFEAVDRLSIRQCRCRCDRRGGAVRSKSIRTKGTAAQQRRERSNKRARPTIARNIAVDPTCCRKGVQITHTQHGDELPRDAEDQLRWAGRYQDETAETYLLKAQALAADHAGVRYHVCFYTTRLTQALEIAKPCLRRIKRGNTCVDGGLTVSAAASALDRYVTRFCRFLLKMMFGNPNNGCGNENLLEFEPAGEVGAGVCLGRSRTDEQVR